MFGEIFGSIASTVSSAWNSVSSVANSAIGVIKDNKDWLGPVSNALGAGMSVMGAGGASQRSPNMTSIMMPSGVPAVPTRNEPVNAKKTNPAAIADPLELQNRWMNQMALFSQSAPQSKGASKRERDE